MKFLLVAVNAKYIHSNPAVYSLRAYADQDQERVEIAEYTINQQLDRIIADIYQKKPDVIAFSCYIWNWDVIQNIIDDLHQLLPELPIWLGGPEVSFNPEEILVQYPFLTGIMVGEGEATFQELLVYYLRHEAELSQIAGLVTANGRTAERPLLDLNEIPFFYKDFSYFQNRIIYYESSRGCPYRCSYCLSSIDKSLRLREVSLVEKELQFFLDASVPQVKFVDRTFNCNSAHAMAIWTYLKVHDNGITNFHFEVAADIMTDEELELLQTMRPGLVQLEIGVQSVNPQTIQEINRVMDLKKVEETVKKVHSGNNIHQHLDLIVGLPYEGFESFRESFNTVYRFRPQQLQMGFLKVLKGSLMYSKAKEYQIVYTTRPPYEVMQTRWITYCEVQKLKTVEEMVELYYNSSQFQHTLCLLEVAFPDAFSMYLSLADFYENKGYLSNSPSRAYRYDVLLQFAKEVDPSHEELYRELLTYDIYLREKCKSRPDFAKNLQEQKEKTHLFYQQEEAQKNYLTGYQGYDWKQLERMTHLEFFHYPVWEEEAARQMVRLKEESPVLFDYHEKDPLTNQARVYRV